MKKWKILIRKKILNFLFENLTPETNVSNINHFGKHSKIYMPSKVEGGENIEIGEQSTIGKYSWLEAISFYRGKEYNPKIIIGDHVNIGNFACITSINRVEIGSGSLLSEHVYISDHYHDHNLLSNKNIIDRDLISKGPTIIGKGCFIGFRATILSGVMLGDNCVVGANSVVTKNFPSNSMIAGIPARLIKTYSDEINDWI